MFVFADASLYLFSQSYSPVISRIYLCFCWLFEQVQKHVQIRMEAYHNYIDSLIAMAYKIVSEQIALSGFGSVGDLPNLANAFICSLSDPSSQSNFHESSVGSIKLHSAGGKHSPPSAIECQFNHQEPLKHEPCWGKLEVHQNQLILCILLAVVFYYILKEKLARRFGSNLWLLEYCVKKSHQQTSVLDWLCCS